MDMIYLDDVDHPYFKSLNRYIQERIPHAIISNDYSLKGTWIMNYWSIRKKHHFRVPKYIAIHSEQMNAQGRDYRMFLSKAKSVLDMSVDFRVGYSDHWRLEAEEAKEIDVLFYGSLNDRREKILAQIPSAVKVTDVFGNSLQKLIRSAKIVLSIHYYPKPMNDMARIAPLLSNKVFVIAEQCTETWFNNSGGVVVSEVEKIPYLCEYYLKNPLERIKWQDKGFEWVNKIRSSHSWHENI
jgi:hypothetical protein